MALSITQTPSYPKHWAQCPDVTAHIFSFLKRLATVNFRSHHVNYLALHGVLKHGTQTLKS